MYRVDFWEFWPAASSSIFFCASAGRNSQKSALQSYSIVNRVAGSLLRTSTCSSFFLQFFLCCSWWNFSKISVILEFYNKLSSKPTFENFYLQQQSLPPIFSVLQLVKFLQSQCYDWLLRGIEKQAVENFTCSSFFFDFFLCFSW